MTASERIREAREQREQTPAEQHAEAIARALENGPLGESFPAYGSSCDALFGIAGHVSREYGDYGYRASIIGTWQGGAIAEVRHSDGSRFLLVADRYGNVARVADAA
jgi:hypothetical protein